MHLPAKFPRVLDAAPKVPRVLDTSLLPACWKPPRVLETAPRAGVPGSSFRGPQGAPVVALVPFVAPQPMGLSEIEGSALKNLWVCLKLTPEPPRVLEIAPRATNRPARGSPGGARCGAHKEPRGAPCGGPRESPGISLWGPTKSPGELVVGAQKEPRGSRCGGPQGAPGSSLWGPARSPGELVGPTRRAPRATWIGGTGRRPLQYLRSAAWPQRWRQRKSASMGQRYHR